MRWKLTIIILGVLGLIVGGIFFMSKQTSVQNLSPERLNRIMAYANDSYETKGGFSKNYTSSNERVVIKDSSDQTILDIKLLTPLNNQVAEGNDVKGAEFFLQDYS